MKRAWILFFLVVASIGPLAVGAPVPTETTVFAAPESSTGAFQDASSFVAEQQRFSDTLSRKLSTQELAQLRDSLPPYWTVQTEDGPFEISTQEFKEQLGTGKSDGAKVWIDHLLQESRGYSQAATPSHSDPKESRAELDRILADSEFAAVHPPSWWDLFHQRLSAWVERMLLKLFGGMARYPIGGQILFWVVVVAGVGFIAMWLFRFLSSRDRMAELEGSEIVSASRTWQEWIRLTREAAARGAFREAIHAGYWAGITRLEDAGIVPKDRTKTPREYLRLVTAAQASQVSGAKQPTYREPLADLTSRFERCWYANRGASRDDYQETLRHLEAMGCQLE